MRFLGTDGYEIIVNLDRASKIRRTSTSKYQENVGEILEALFPGLDIYTDFPIEGMFIDFFVPSIMLAVEVDGEQHEKFNKFFHKSGGGFVRHIKRDEQKNEFCRLNDITLVRIPQGDALNDDLVIERLRNELES